MLEEFCEKNHCYQYIPSIGRFFAQCLMVQRELFRVSDCPLHYGKIAVKANPEERHNSLKRFDDDPKRKKGFNIRSRRAIDMDGQEDCRCVTMHLINKEYEAKKKPPVQIALMIS
ncbi:MAG: hypothetical protein PHT99_08300 [Methanoregula sp.]|nr:hypothetical protein [Methanoregula sp.]